MRVLKFGGTSIGDAQSIRTVCEIVRRRAGDKTLLVFSAAGGTTDALDAMARSAAKGLCDDAMAAAKGIRDAHLSLARELLPPGEALWRLETLFEQFFGSARDAVHGLAVLKDLSPAVQDRLWGMGELLSTNLLCEVLRREGVPAEWVDARDVVITDGRHGQAEPIPEKTAERCQTTLLPLLDAGRFPVTQGFIGRSEGGEVTTLGRGGSDYTASLLGALLGAEAIEIWTDVDGVMTADPSLVPQARNIPLMSFREAAELAFFGARVLHPKTLWPAVERGIPVRVLNTRRPDGEGTTILAEVPREGGSVQSIAYKEDVALVTLVCARMFKARGFLRRLFDALDAHGVTPDAVATSEVSVALALHAPSDLEGLVRDLGEYGTVSVRRGQAIVCVVGEGLKNAPGIVGQVFEGLEGVRISLVSQGGSAINLGFVVDERDLPEVVSRLHRRFFERPALPARNQGDGLYGPPALL